MPYRPCLHQWRWAVALLVLGTAPLAAQPRSQATDLTPGASIERRLAAGEIQAYVATLDAERRYLIEVEQRGIDVVVEAIGPDGMRLAVDAPTYRHGMESLLLPAMAAGVWRVEVRSASPAVGPGEVALRLVDLSTAPPARLAAEAATTEAGKLYREGTPEARRQAIAKLEEALPWWQELGDRRRQAVTRLSLGVLHTKAGEPRQAADAYSLARPILQVLGEQALEAIALCNEGLAYWKLGDSDKAQALLDQALALQRSLGNRYGVAITLNNLCLRAHSRGRLSDARDCYREVLDLLRELEELEYEALVLSNLGSVYNNLGEPQLALDHHRRALRLRQSTGDRGGEAKTLNYIAVVHRRIGEMQQALDHYHRALEIRRELGDEKGQASILNNIGYAYFSLGEPRLALAFLHQALTLRRKIEDRRGESITLNVFGQIQAALGQDAEALELYRQALALRRAVGDRRGEASTLNLIGRGLLASSDPAAALGFFDQALEILTEVEDRREAAIGHHDQGEARLMLGELGAAKASLDLALHLRIATGDPHGEAQTLTSLAKVERRLGDLDAARQRIEAALAKIESLRTGVGSADLRATFLASRRQAYELNVDLLMELDAATPGDDFARQALAASERARARSLLDMLSRAGAELGADDPELTQRRDALLRRLDAKATRRLSLLSRGRAEAESELELYQVIAELDRLEAEIRRQSPRYDALTRPRPLDLGEIQDLLDGDTLLLEYALGPERSFLWAVGTNTFAAHSLPGRSVIEAAARDVARYLSTFDPRAGTIERQAARDLSRLLLGPVAERLDGQRLVVVADGALHYVPFGTLPVPDTGESSGSGTRPGPLIARHEVVHLPSASSLAVQRAAVSGRPAAPRWVAVLADPVFDTRDPRLAARVASGAVPASTGQRAEDLGLVFDRLPSTRREAAVIAELAPPGDVLAALDFDASRKLVTSDELHRYRIVHFATHGLIDDARPHLSGLVLSLFDERGQPREGFLRLRDVYNLELGADLVVLSGCRTALGRQVLGEGLMGLTRGFMYAGVPRVVASLWRVEDRATAELMARFYRAMAVDGKRPAAALRAAQLSIRQERGWRDPYYWGAFVLQGDWR